MKGLISISNLFSNNFKPFMEPVFHSRNKQPLERCMSQQTWGGSGRKLQLLAFCWRFCPARTGDVLTADYPEVASFHFKHIREH